MEFLKDHQLDIMLLLSGVCFAISIMGLFSDTTSVGKISMFMMGTASALLLIADRLSYIYRGNESELGYRMVRICNFLVFFFTLTTVHALNIYITDKLKNVARLNPPPIRLRLTDEEYDKIKTHSTIGYRILKRISMNPSLCIGAHYHHERYDGKGYPDGLKGSEIPEVARIIAVADAYDAMASKRSYRDQLPQHKVREEISKGKGTQFDPVFADIILKLIDEDADYEMREK